MRIKLVAAFCLLYCLALTVPAGATSAQGDKKGSDRETFSALANILPAGATRNVTIYIDSYSTDQEAQQLEAISRSGGQDALLNALEKMKPIGRIESVGTISFYDFKLIISKPTPTGRHIIAITDRPMGFREEARDARSTEYPFGILQLDLKDDKKGKDKKGKEEGEGTLIYAAQIKDLNLDELNVENYGADPVKLLGVRQL
jgi:hypothetical protein